MASATKQIPIEDNHENRDVLNLGGHFLAT